MTTIESNKVSLNASPEAAFTYVSDLNNLIELLPQDKVSEWQGSADKCSFKVSGGYKIGLAHKSLESPGKIVLQSTDGSALSFDLDIRFTADGAGTTAGLTAHLDVNPFMKMMVEKPLKNLFDYIASKLAAKFS